MSHEPVIEKELREFAYYRLAKTDLDGNPIEGNTQRRYFHHDDKEFGLLKFRIYSDQGEVDTHYEPDFEKRQSPGIYRIRKPEDSLLRRELYFAVVPCDDIDNMIVKRLLERIEELSKKQESIEIYEANAVVVRSKRLSKIKQIEESINDIDKHQGGLTRNLGRVEIEIEDAEREKDEAKKEVKERRKELIEKEIEMLEIERKRLIKAKELLEEEIENDIGTLEEELVKLKNGWSQYRFKRRRSLINFAIREVRINKVSTHWIEIQVLWLHEEWGHEHMYYRRQAGSIKQWSSEEIAIVETHYATMSIIELMALLPDRTWHAIRFYAGQHLDLPKRRRQNRVLSISLDNSYSDMEFEKSKGISNNVSYANWEPLSLR
ncbi:MAG: hypothetical protein H0V70_07610 [Ktedonobacteraceae bacterium]|nr:hypothetical protein [Ktedonobacteraceae bacterium]